jgi:tRNA-intron endonuclease
MAKKKEVKIKAVFSKQRVIAEDKGAAKELYNQSRFGEPKDNKLQYSLVEGLYLLEKGKMNIKYNKNLKFDDFIKVAQEIEPNFWVRYCVFKDLRQRGYIVKTALKFGADFRVYDRGIKPGEDHAKWIVFPVHEGETLTWYEFSAKNRVAHSTRKRLLIGCVDDENDVTYWEISWKRP